VYMATCAAGRHVSCVGTECDESKAVVVKFTKFRNICQGKFILWYNVIYVYKFCKQFKECAVLVNFILTGIIKITFH
jgi:hypothetical protein